MTTKLTEGDKDLIDLAAAAIGGYAGYLWLDFIIPGVGGYWGFAIGASIFGGLMMAIMDTKTGKAWAKNLVVSVDAMIADPVVALANYITALLIFDIGWDYAFEFFDPVFDIIFEIIPGGFEIWPYLNPYGGGFLGASAIIAALITLGWYELIAWPNSCVMWMFCQLIGGGGKGGCAAPKYTGFPCPGGFLAYPCPSTYPWYKKKKDGDFYTLWSLPGDLVHIGLIPLAMPLCLGIQALRGVGGGKGGGGSRPLTGFDILMFPYNMLHEFVISVGVLFLDIGGISATPLGDFTHIFNHLFDSIKCKSWGMEYGDNPL